MISRVFKNILKYTVCLIPLMILTITIAIVGIIEFMVEGRTHLFVNIGEMWMVF